MMATCARSSLSRFDPLRQEQREHHAGHEQQRDQRHAADQLDIQHAQRLHRRQLRRAAAQRHQHREREGEGEAEGGQDQRQRQPAPLVLRHEGQPGEAAPHQDADHGQDADPDQQQLLAPEPRAWRTRRTAPRNSDTTSAGRHCWSNGNRPNRMSRYFSSSPPSRRPRPARRGRPLVSGAVGAVGHGPDRVDHAPLDELIRPAREQQAKHDVTIADGQEPNRLVRAQPIGPVRRRPGGAAAGRPRPPGRRSRGPGRCRWSRSRSCSALHQGDAGVVPVHEQADATG